MHSNTQADVSKADPMESAWFWFEDVREVIGCLTGVVEKTQKRSNGREKGEARNEKRGEDSRSESPMESIGDSTPMSSSVSACNLGVSSTSNTQETSGEWIQAENETNANTVGNGNQVNGSSKCKGSEQIRRSTSCDHKGSDNDNDNDNDNENDSDKENIRNVTMRDKTGKKVSDEMKSKTMLWASPCSSRDENVNFFLYSYKVKGCPHHRNCPHKVTCEWYHHDGERRRNPGPGPKFWYCEEACPIVKPLGTFKWLPPSRCVHGDGCKYSHTILEQMYHPNIYKTSMCINFTHPYGNCCKWGFYCTHAHGQDDVRVPLFRRSTAIAISTTANGNHHHHNSNCNNNGNNNSNENNNNSNSNNNNNNNNNDNNTNTNTNTNTNDNTRTISGNGNSGNCKHGLVPRTCASLMTNGGGDDNKSASLKNTMTWSKSDAQKQKEIIAKCAAILTERFENLRKKVQEAKTANHCAAWNFSQLFHLPISASTSQVSPLLYDKAAFVPVSYQQQQVQQQHYNANTFLHFASPLCNTNATSSFRGNHSFASIAQNAANPNVTINRMEQMGKAMPIWVRGDVEPHALPLIDFSDHEDDNDLTGTFFPVDDMGAVTPSPPPPTFTSIPFQTHQNKGAYCYDVSIFPKVEYPSYPNRSIVVDHVDTLYGNDKTVDRSVSLAQEKKNSS
ncbi:hypothetical protein RFI_13049 [Reticulomyxa filosa]|uniref:C3H1-type domain-containing protein n=1 Tax=Reticulomyxa filosa TaxID=46433 RepID=X6NCR4_RETFI|nr:hypothetical protein RFI_13049 [Reticulomyxa filosa]|eukprot:ETO24110.1 hypothetical protein RFI_13049 [Reticulomyxa filosa]